MIIVQLERNYRMWMGIYCEINVWKIQNYNSDKGVHECIWNRKKITFIAKISTIRVLLSLIINFN